ncbi:MAG: helix-turn-helix transcriptional regulator [Clostridia bacterium]|nr:helix-turn-helix transcriptional regulator [Clostridia bacterium]
MNELASVIEQQIKKQYKSIRQFSLVSGIPQTTIVSAIKNGVCGTAYETVIKICELLHIELVNYNTHLVMTNDVINMVNMFNSLDEKGEHAVMAFMAMEFNRCNGSLDYIAKATEQSNEIARRKAQNPFEMINVISNQNKTEEF